MTRATPFTPSHPDLANAAGVPARLANEKYVESLARIYVPTQSLLDGTYKSPNVQRT
ncbi:MAG TPA: hypothetical protein VFC01_18855 [Mycobacterium sp.]|nr:hypothetical protein [Mycobacterium sp.]